MKFLVKLIQSDFRMRQYDWEIYEPNRIGYEKPVFISETIGYYSLRIQMLFLQNN